MNNVVYNHNAAKAVGLDELAVERAKEIYKDMYFQDALSDLLNNSDEMENDDSFVMDDNNDDPIEPAANVFNVSALALTRVMSQPQRACRSTQ